MVLLKGRRPNSRKQFISCLYIFYLIFSTSDQIKSPLVKFKNLHHHHHHRKTITNQGLISPWSFTLYFNLLMTDCQKFRKCIVLYTIQLLSQLLIFMSIFLHLSSIYIFLKRRRSACEIR